MRQSLMTDPNFLVRTGPARILHVPFASGAVFRRRGGKAVDLHHRYQAATANSSNLAGFAVVDEVGVTNGHPATVANDDKLPVDFGLEVAAVFPTTGRVATENDRGKAFDIYVDGDGKQFINLGASSKGVLVVSDLVTDDGAYVACAIPTDLRYGNL